MSDIRWYPEDSLMGHARYCAHPYHSLMYHCAADPAEPATMRGEPSQAWIRDHAEPPTGATTMGDKTAPGYAGPTGQERPGEHWNARAIRELAEHAATGELTMSDGRIAPGYAGPATGEKTTMSTVNEGLLRTYDGGPVIWDAASLLPDVTALADAGLIEPVPGSAAYQLTNAGRARLGAAPYSELVGKVAGLMMNGLYEPGQYVKSAHMRAGYLHEDGQGGAWFYAETDEENTGVERVRVTITPA
jgi:hypothetical protein